MRSNRNNDGRRFENMLHATLTQYEGKGIMRVKKCSPPARIMAGGKRMILMENPWLDWAGVWTARKGRAIIFESKSTSEPRLPLARSGGVTENQLSNIHKWDASGAATFILWEFKGEVKFIWGMAAVATEQGGDKSIHWDNPNCEPVQQGVGFVHYDFVKVMQEFWE